MLDRLSYTRLFLLSGGVLAWGLGCGPSTGAANGGVADLAVGALRDLTLMTDSALPADASVPPDLAVSPDLLPAPCYAAYFDGVAAAATAPYVAGIAPAGSITYEAWVYPTGIGTPINQVVMARWEASSAANQSAFLGLETTQHPFFEASDGSSIDGLTSGSAVTINQWHHLAGVFDLAGKTLYVFVDGSVVKQSVVPLTGLLTAAGAVLAIGNASSVNASLKPYVGWIGEVRISSVARYTAKFTPAKTFIPDAQTLALYHFDEAAGTTARDSSPKNNPATLKSNAIFKVPPICR